nr:SLBB domain-containing protein [uncultured Mucilaginibacter sp.]
MSSLNVDELSDAQIKQLMQQAQSSGLSDAQLLQMAQSRNMPAAQIQRLQTRIADIRRKDGSSGNQNTNSGDTILQSRGRSYRQDTSENSNSGKSGDIFSTLRPQIFGSSLFRNSSAKTFEPNLRIATPVNYIVGPDDVLQINVYGNSLANWKLTVSPEGKINIPGIGTVNVAGKTIETATAMIKRTLAANRYAIGRGTEVEVNLGDIRSIKVMLQGQVLRPGTYTVSSLSTVFNALYAAGGPSDIGSFRDIELIRDNKIIRHLDLYDFLVKGSQKDNIGLKDQDVIRVPTYRLRVELKGEVKIPAIFEMKSGESLQDLIDFSGGFTDEAYTARIKINQVSDQQRRITDVVEADFKTYSPLRGDKFVVERILDRFENRVIIKGAVFHPGEFELQKGLTVSQLIKNAGGLKEDAFTGRASIIRLNPDNTTQHISFNLQDVISKASADILLQREDSVTVSSLFELRDKYKVTIKGEVRHAGEFVYADSMKVADLIVKAGGFSEGASAKRIEVSRRVFDSDPRVINSDVAQVFSVDVSGRLQENGLGFTLKPFDIVSIYSLPGYETQKTVKVEGEVIYPGPYTIKKKNEKISDILARAGGLTMSADIDGSSLKRDNAAVLGVDRSKTDTNALNNERNARLRQFQRTYSAKDKDSLNVDTSQLRNNYIGINLRRILEKPGTGDDIILENGDVLRIPKKQQIVRVNGEVLYPSAVVYEKGKSFKGYVLNSGGYSAKALKRGAYIVYANGTVKGTRKFLFFNIHPSVKPGSEIYVPKKLPSPANTAQVILGFTTGLASLGAIVLGILSLNR